MVQAGRRGLGPHVRVQPRLQVTRRPGAHTHAHTHTLVSPPPSRARTLHTNIHAHTHDIFFIDNDNHHNTYMIYMPVASAGLLCAVPPVTVYDYVTTYTHSDISKYIFLKCYLSDSCFINVCSMLIIITIFSFTKASA